MASLKRKWQEREVALPEVVEEEKSLSSNGCEWVRGRMLGKGRSGSVHLASVKKSKLGLPLPEVMAVKSTFLYYSDELKRENMLLQELSDCPFIIHRYGQDVTVGKDGNLIFNLLLEFAYAGTMADLIMSCGGCGLGETWEVKKYIGCILRGLKCIHERGFVHCDIKPENILLVENKDPADGTHYVPKIGDFRRSKRAGIQNFDKPYCNGTAMYAPEAVNYGIQEQPSDIWALGCLVLKMLTGRRPWKVKSGAKHQDILSLIASESPNVPAWLSVDAKDFLEKCFVRNPIERFTAAMLLDHPFVTKLDGIREVYPLKDVPSSVSSSKHCDDHLDYGSLIPLGSCSSEVLRGGAEWKKNMLTLLVRRGQFFLQHSCT